MRWPVIRFGLTSQFLTFVALTSVLPIALIGLFSYFAVDAKFQARTENLLNMGVFVSQSVIAEGLDNLQFKIQQGANYPIRTAYLSYLKTHDKAALQKALKAYEQETGTDMLRLYDASLHQVAVSSPKTVTAPLTNDIRKIAATGVSIQTIGRYVRARDHRLDLAYAAVVPIFSPTQPRKIIGVLSGRYSMSQSFAFQRVLRAVPVLQVRIVSEDLNGHLALLSSSGSNLRELPPDSAFHEAFETHKKPIYAAGFQVSPPFHEQIGKNRFRTIAIRLQRFQGVNIGYLLLSCSESDLITFLKANFQTMEWVILFALLTAIAAAYFFKRTFVNPVDQLANVSERVANGDKTLRASSQNMQPKIQAMVINFNRMLDQLQEDDLLKRTFISTLTHDLRTPLFAQERIFKTLQKTRGKNDPDLLEILQGLDQNNANLLEMVEKMLESYQYEAGAIALHRESVDIAALVTECCRAVAPLADSKAIRLNNDILPRRFYCDIDPLQLQRVFVNLLSNGIENIQENRQITLTAEQAAQTVLISVSDNGPGISAEVLPHIFQRYYSGHPTRQKIGSGLGLFICRMIIELHGGTIAVSSQMGAGTHYILSLPATSPESLPTTWR